MSATRKRYYYKVYDVNQKYITTWSTDVISDPNFRTVLNGGSGELLIDLARKHDNFGEGNDVALMNRVELWVADNDNLANNITTVQWDVSKWDVDFWDNPLYSFRKIYSGYISAYAPTLGDGSSEGEKEYIEVTCLGFVTEASYKIVSDLSGNTNFTLSAMDPSSMMKKIIDYYRADGNTNINYLGSSIQTTGLTATYVFNEMTLQECIDAIISITPAGWYWYIDPNGTLFMKKASISADHSLVIGRDTGYLASNKRVENVVNSLYIIGGGSPPLYNWYKRSASISSYGLFEQKLQDGLVTDNATADLMAKRILDTYQLPETRAVINVIDNNGENSGQGQDIESFSVGDTVQIKNLSYGSKSVSLWDKAVYDTDVWDQTFQFTLASILTIVSIDYYPTYIQIEVSSRLPEITKRIETISKILDNQVQNGIPIAPSSRFV